jgi:hypothetical protein
MVLQVAGFTNTEAETSPDAAKAALNCIRERIFSLEAEVQDLRLKVIFFLLFSYCSFLAKSNTERLKASAGTGRCSVFGFGGHKWF